MLSHRVCSATANVSVPMSSLRNTTSCALKLHELSLTGPGVTARANEVKADRPRHDEIHDSQRRAPVSFIERRKGGKTGAWNRRLTQCPELEGMESTWISQPGCLPLLDLHVVFLDLFSSSYFLSLYFCAFLPTSFGQGSFVFYFTTTRRPSLSPFCYFTPYHVACLI